MGLTWPMYSQQLEGALKMFEGNFNRLRSSPAVTVRSAWTSQVIQTIAAPQGISDHEK